MDDELEQYRRKAPEKIVKTTQQVRDLESLDILKAERNKPYNQNERASLEREIQRVSKLAGVAYDLGMPAARQAEPVAVPAQEKTLVDRSVVPPSPGSASWDQPIRLMFGGTNPANATGQYMPRPVDVMQPNSLNETNASFQKRVTEAQREYDARRAAIGGGRGGRGGPTAEQAAEMTFAAPEYKPRAQIVPAALQGAAQGATAGTFDYLPAGMAYAYSRIRDKLGSGRPDNYTFKELLAGQRANRQAVAAESPVAYTLGDVGGSIGLGYATGGASIPATMASQGAQSAVRKYTESADTNLQDAATAGAIGAGLSGAIGAAGRAVGSVATSLKDSVLKKALSSRNEKAAPTKKAIEEHQAAQKASDEAYFKSLPESGPIPARPILPKPTAPAPMTMEEYAAQKATEPLTSLAGKKIRHLTKNVGASVTIPGLLGAGTAYAVNENPQWGIDPLLAGAVVAGGTPLATSSGRVLAAQGPSRLKEMAGLAVNKYPNAIPNATRAGAVTTGATVNQLQRPNQQEPDFSEDDLAELNQFRRK